LIENSYGVAKRINWVRKTVDRHCPKQALNILDFGCGTGQITLSLAEEGHELHGLDADTESISAAKATSKEKGLTNARFYCNSLDSWFDKHREFYDVVICSEVLEHIIGPEEVLNKLNALLKRNGLLIVTIPNGLGPAEIERALQYALMGIGVFKLIVTLSNYFKGVGRISDKAGEEYTTCAHENLHVNFFSLKDIKNLIRCGGFEHIEICGRTFTCGIFTDTLIKILLPIVRSLAGWYRVNNYLGSAFPLPAVSGWMIACVKSNKQLETAGYIHERDMTFRSWTRLKRRLNLFRIRHG